MSDRYYDRELLSVFAQLLEPNGKLCWLYDYVKQRSDLDFLVGKNNGVEWISVYRGLSRIITIKRNLNSSGLRIEAANKYLQLADQLGISDIYGEIANNTIADFSSNLNLLVSEVEKTPDFDRYYNTRKEGYYQNQFSRQYGMCSSASEDFVIIDKEAVIGYKNKDKKADIFGSLQKRFKNMQKIISSKDPERFGSQLVKKSIGNELDFIAVRKNGDLLLIEFKDGSNTSGIYLSPLQIGLYVDIFEDARKNIKDFDSTILRIIEQKRRLGLINSGWPIPKKIQKLIPVLIISEFNYKSSAKEKYNETMALSRDELGNSFLNNIETYNYKNKVLYTW